MDVVELKEEKERIVSENKLMFLLKEKTHESLSGSCDCRICLNLTQLDKMLVEINTLIRVARGVPERGAITNKKEKLDRLKKANKYSGGRKKKCSKNPHKNEGDVNVKGKVKELMREGLNVREISDKLNEPYGNVYYHFKNIEKEEVAHHNEVKKEDIAVTSEKGHDHKNCQWVLSEVIDLLGDDVMIKVNESIVDNATGGHYKKVKRLSELAIKLESWKGGKEND